MSIRLRFAPCGTGPNLDVGVKYDFDTHDFPKPKWAARPRSHEIHDLLGDAAMILDANHGGKMDTFVSRRVITRWLCTGMAVPLFGGGLSGAAYASDVQRVIVSDTTFYIPKTWIDEVHQSMTFELATGAMTHAASDADYVVQSIFMNLSVARQIDFAPFNKAQLPQWLIITAGNKEIGAEDVSWQKKFLDEALATILKSRSPDEDGFVRVDPREYPHAPNGYVLVGSEQYRPLGLPLVVPCNPRSAKSEDSLDRYCRIGLGWKLDVGATYDFDTRDFPKPKWATLDREVMRFMTF